MIKLIFHHKYYNLKISKYELFLPPFQNYFRFFFLSLSVIHFFEVLVFSTVQCECILLFPLPNVYCFLYSNNQTIIYLLSINSIFQLHPKQFVSVIKGILLSAFPYLKTCLKKSLKIQSLSNHQPIRYGQKNIPHSLRNPNSPRTLCQCYLKNQVQLFL